jgi:iron(III) transport system ATP-binding protein
MTDPAVRTVNLTKYYGETCAIDQLDLEVQRGEILTVLGPSGCGKTTFLRLLAGFEQPTQGKVFLGGQVVANRRRFVPPESREVGMVFQEHALFPHLTVFENIAYGLQKFPTRERGDTVHSMLTLVGLENYSGRFPHELSGGERQRVALARALAPRPILILLDEPFSNLDADRRWKMRDEVRAILTGIDATAIFVTHDQDEALFMGDRLAVIRSGALEQIGTPEDVFHNPETRFVAEFMGQTEFLPGQVIEGGIDTEVGFLRQPTDFPVGTPLDIAIRPDDVSFEPRADGDGLVLARHFKGESNLYRLRLPSGRLIHSIQPHTRIISPGTRVKIFADPGHTLSYFPLGGANAKSETRTATSSTFQSE